jgi:hypothetical protein
MMVGGYTFSSMSAGGVVGSPTAAGRERRFRIDYRRSHDLSQFGQKWCFSQRKQTPEGRRSLLSVGYS